MIAAAGSGQRLGAGGPKAFVELAGRPLIGWSLEALGAAELVGEIVVAAPPGSEGDPALGAAKVVTGGPSRAESVRLAMEAVDADLVVIHDAARPLAAPELFDRVVARLAGSGAEGVIAAAPVADTLKRVGGQLAIEKTVDRAGLWGAQTPQAFRAEALRAAQAEDELRAATDEAWLIERAGGTVLVEPTEEPNLKVTTLADLAVAASILAVS